MNMRSNVMNMQSLAATIRTRILAPALVIGGALLAGGLPVHAAWEYAHGDTANTGFAMVDTAPAWWWWSHIQPLGSIAPGANPVVGPNGDVYVGSLQGELRAFHADGTPYWTRQLNSLHGGIFAAPVIGTDGSIYVVSSIRYTDHRDGVANERNDSYMHKFNPGGAWVFAKPFPELFPTSPTMKNRGGTTAPPNIWRANGIEAVMVPVVYRGYDGNKLHVIAFSTSGDVLAEKRVEGASETTGGSSEGWMTYCLLTNWWNGEAACGIMALITGDYMGFHSDGVILIPLAGAGVPLPGVAIRPDPSGGPPFVMVTDGRHDKVAYTFSPQTGFSEAARSRHLRRQFTTPPLVLPNGDTWTGTLDGYLTRTGQNFVQLGAIYAPGSTLTAALTRLSDGGIVVVSRGAS